MLGRFYQDPHWLSGDLDPRPSSLACTPLLVTGGPGSLSCTSEACPTGPVRQLEKMNCRVMSSYCSWFSVDWSVLCGQRKAGLLGRLDGMEVRMDGTAHGLAWLVYRKGTHHSFRKQDPN